MNRHLVRTTIYFDPLLLKLAKKQAIDENKPLYEVVNEALQKKLQVKKTSRPLSLKKEIQYTDFFPTYNLGLGKKTIKRSDAYE